MKKPLVLDLFCGLWGWTEGFIAQGWQSVGIDLKVPGSIPEGARFFQYDIAELKPQHIREISPDFIVASPPCTEYSYRAMPWKRARLLPPPIILFSNDVLKFKDGHLLARNSFLLLWRMYAVPRNMSGKHDGTMGVSIYGEMFPR